MTTNLDVIRDALRLLGVLPEAQEPSAEQSQDALAVMNDFLEDWSASEIEVGQWPQTQLDAPFPGGGEVVATAKATLAVQLAPYYERPLHPAILAQANRGYARLLRQSVVGQLRPADMSGMPPSSLNSFNILTGE